MNLTKRKKVKLILIMALFTLMVLACYSTVSYAASGTSTGQDNNGSILDPFSLNIMIMTSTDNGSGAVEVRPPVRISVRPSVRSYFRPPLTY